MADRGSYNFWRTDDNLGTRDLYMNEDIYVWPDGSWSWACDYCWETDKWKGDDYRIVSGDEYVYTPEGNVIIKETGEVL